MAERQIEERLKSPSTAEFRWIYERKFDVEKEEIYIYATVDAQNSYGGMIRNKFTVTLQAYTEEEFENLTEKHLPCRVSVGPLYD